SEAKDLTSQIGCEIPSLGLPRTCPLTPAPLSRTRARGSPGDTTGCHPPRCTERACAPQDDKVGVLLSATTTILAPPASGPAGQAAPTVTCRRRPGRSPVGAGWRRSPSV